MKVKTSIFFDTALSVNIDHMMCTKYLPNVAVAGRLKKDKLQKFIAKF